MTNDTTTASPERTVAPYKDLRVLQMQGGIEVAYCTKILADAGAEVAYIETAEDHPLRRRGGREGTAPLFSYLHHGKHSVSEDVKPLDELLSSVDVAVADCLPDTWEELQARHPHLTMVAITPFGLEGPWTSRPATDLTMQAAAGGMAPRGAIGEEPLMVGGEPSTWFAGAVAAVSTLGVLPRTTLTGKGELVDVSIFESTHIEHGMHPVTFASMANRPFQTTRGTPVPGIEPTSDGHVGFFVITGQQWLDFCALIGRPQWGEDESLFIATERRYRADELLGPIREWTMSQTTEEIVDVASLMRIPVAPIGNGASLPDIDQFVAEEWFVENPDGFVQPRRPYRFQDEHVASPPPTPPSGTKPEHWTALERAISDHGELPLSGLRVADFTGFWAGPMASGVLAGLGADVIHIEGPRRPDGIRMNTIRSMDQDQWWEWSPLFCGANTNKRDLTLDLSVEAGRDVALRLLATCDVMIENFSPRVVDQLGLSPDVVTAANPNIVIVRMPAFGLNGPWRDRVGFAQTIEQAVGLAFLTGYPQQAPLIPNGMCDPLAGVYGAIAALVALAERDRTGTHQVVESPMVGAGLHVSAEQVVDFSAFGHLHVSLGNQSSLIEQDVYRCAGDDEWIAISIPDESVRAELYQRTRCESLEQVEEWCRLRSPQEVAETLETSGVAVAPVVWAQDTISNPQLNARGFFESVDHPICGTHPYVSWPARFSEGPQKWNRTPAPTMGQHNREILAELGITKTEVDALYETQVVADGVLTSQRGW